MDYLHRLGNNWNPATNFRGRPADFATCAWRYNWILGQDNVGAIGSLLLAGHSVLPLVHLQALSLDYRRDGSNWKEWKTAYLATLSEIVDRLKALGIPIVETVNEGNDWLEGTGPWLPAHLYRELHQEVYALCRDKDMLLVAGSLFTHNQADGRAYFEGAADYCDFINLHLYQTTVDGMWAMIRRWKERYPGKQIIVSEMGFNHADPPLYEAMSAVRAGGADVALWFCLQSFMASGRLQDYGVIGLNGLPNPAYDAFRGIVHAGQDNRMYLSSPEPPPPPEPEPEPEEPPIVYGYQLSPEEVAAGVELYPERRADGSVWVVRYDPNEAEGSQYTQFGPVEPATEPPPPPPLLKAIDVSSHQPTELGALIVKHKIEMAIVRLYIPGERPSPEISLAQIASARTYCDRVGGYMWAYRSFDPRKSIRDAIRLGRSCGIGFTIHLDEAKAHPEKVLWIDCETYDVGRGVEDPGPDAEWLRAAIAQARRQNVIAGIYTGAWWWRQYMGNTVEFGDVPLWAAEYNLIPDLDSVALFGGWGPTMLRGHQFLVYLPDNLDLNVFGQG